MSDEGVIILGLVGMFLCYRIAKLVILGHQAPPDRKAKREPLDQGPYIQDLLDQCARLTQRVLVLEEIIRKDNQHPPDDRR